MNRRAQLPHAQSGGVRSGHAPIATTKTACAAGVRSRLDMITMQSTSNMMELLRHIYGNFLSVDRIYDI